MTCDLCGKTEATVHLTEIINDQTRELHLCEVCAREKGEKAAQDFGLADLLAGLADFSAKTEQGAKAPLACAHCGMTYEEFRKTGRLGCGRCYESFYQVLAPLLKRIHGSIQHIGKTPAKLKRKAPRGPEDLVRLKERLKKVVASESFEEAVQLRDQIRALEAKLKRAKPPAV